MRFPQTWKLTFRGLSPQAPYNTHRLWFVHVTSINIQHIRTRSSAVAVIADGAAYDEADGRTVYTL